MDAWFVTLLACLACGLLSGFLAGMLGIGGGLIVVPTMLVLLPSALESPSGVPQMAVATSLTAMIPTTVTALIAQQRRGAVDLVWLRRLVPGACAGALFGALLMPRLDSRCVAVVFVFYAAYFSLRLLLAARGRALPAPWNAWPWTPVAAGIGALSVLAGVGGAIFTVPYLEGRHVRMTHAVGTSSGVALALSLVAVASFAWTPHATEASLVWWPAALTTGAAAVCTASLGVRLAHRWPTVRLKRAFAWLLLLAAAASLWKLWHT
jgi:uncharacterized membrane protein YfcA